MTKYIHISLTKDGEVIVDYSRGLDPMDMLEALGVTTRMIYKKIIEEEARKANMDEDAMDKLARLIAKQKDPKQN